MSAESFVTLKRRVYEVAGGTQDRPEYALITITLTMDRVRFSGSAEGLFI